MKDTGKRRRMSSSFQMCRAMRVLVLMSMAMIDMSYATTCDIYDAAKETKCVAAHSTVRALYSRFSGALYQVQRSSDETFLDVSVLSPGGYADAASQDTFCANTDCFITKIYDQSEKGNHLSVAPPGGNWPHEDNPCNASADRLTVGGHAVYSAYFEGHMGYRRDNTSGIATGDDAETMYMVTSGVHYNDKCCFDYGNAETDNDDDGAGTMEAVYFGNAKGGLNHGGAGKGPWIMADMENALWGADVVVSNEPPINHTFVTAMIKGDVSTGKPSAGPYQTGIDFPGNDMSPCGFAGCTLPRDATVLDCEKMCNETSDCVGIVFADASCAGGSSVCWTKSRMSGTGVQASCRNSRRLRSIDGHWAILGGDATAGELKTYWDGKRAPGYAPMKKQGAIILGIGGDNSPNAIGTFYEGVMTTGYASAEVDSAVQANIVAAGYGR